MVIGWTGSIITSHSPLAPASFETVARFQPALIGFGVVWAHAFSTRGPAQERLRPEWKNNGFAVDVRLHTKSFSAGGHSEMKCLAEDNGV